MGYIIKPIDMSDETKAKMREHAITAALSHLQKKNCSGCLFSDRKKVGTGEPCCTRVGGPSDIAAGCSVRRER